MHLAFRIWLGLILLLVLILLSICQGGSAVEFKSLSRQTRAAGCDCRYATDQTLCASNGITYPSMCRFECAKNKNKRLRVVSQGSCRGKTLTDYRRGQNSRRS